MTERTTIIFKGPLPKRIIDAIESALVTNGSYSLVRPEQYGVVFCKPEYVHLAAESMETALQEANNGNDFEIRRRIANATAQYTFPTITPGKHVPLVDVKI